jgi:hypothetical protein
LYKNNIYNTQRDANYKDNFFYFNGCKITDYIIKITAFAVLYSVEYILRFDSQSHATDLISSVIIVILLKLLSHVAKITEVHFYICRAAPQGLSPVSVDKA